MYLRLYGAPGDWQTVGLATVSFHNHIGKRYNTCYSQENNRGPVRFRRNLFEREALTGERNECRLSHIVQGKCYCE